jgi:hypothetical protein
MSGFYFRGQEMKGRQVIATGKKGKEYRYPSILAAAQDLNLSITTIKKKASDGQTVDSKHGLVVIKFVAQ